MSTLKKTAFVATAAAGLALAGAGVASAHSMADGQAVGSPGIVSGNLIQVPVHVPVNACGNTVNGAAGLNPTFGNSCVNS
jgi:hypothetical protein